MNRQCLTDCARRQHSWPWCQLSVRLTLPDWAKFCQQSAQQYLPCKKSKALINVWMGAVVGDTLTRDTLEVLSRWQNSRSANVSKWDLKDMSAVFPSQTAMLRSQQQYHLLLRIYVYVKILALAPILASLSPCRGTLPPFGKNGNTTLDFSTQKGHRDIIALLLTEKGGTKEWGTVMRINLGPSTVRGPYLRKQSLVCWAKFAHQPCVRPNGTTLSVIFWTSRSQNSYMKHCIALCHSCIGLSWLWSSAAQDKS